MGDDLPDILGLSEVMYVLDKSQATVLRLARTGELTGRKIGPGKTAGWAFTREAVLDYMNRKNGDAA